MKPSDLARVNPFAYYRDCIYPLQEMAWQLRNQTHEKPSADVQYEMMEEYFESKQTIGVKE